MTFRILAFGIAQDIMGGPSIAVEADEKIKTVADLKQLLLKRYPQLGSLASVLIAVNKSYADDAMAVTASDEIAIIPPTSGG